MLRFLLLVAFAGLIAGTGFVLMKYPVLRIVTVVCQTDQGQDCPELITADLQELRNSPIFFVNHAAQAQQALAGQPARLNHVQKSLGGELMVSIVIDEPLYTVALDTGETYWIGQSGASSQQLANSPSELPSITVVSEKADEIRENHRAIVALLQYTEQQTLSIETIIWHSHYQVELRFFSIPVPILIDMSHWQADITRAKAVLSLDQLESARTTQFLDARFELPVLRDQLDQERVSQ